MFHRAALRSSRRPVHVPFLIGLALAGCQGAGAPAGDAGATAAASAPDPVERGRYIVTTGACGDCHTPWVMGENGPMPDETRLLSGHPADLPVTPVAMPDGWMMISNITNTAHQGPWGVSFSANLTPHETGLGNLTEELFVQSFRTGQHFGKGRLILPPMPIPAYQAFTDDDLKAIWAYLQSIPPVDNAVPMPIPPAGPPAP